MKGLKIKELEIKSDERGWLAELITNKDCKRFGHLLMFVIRPGQSRGNHYHKFKDEWFFLVKGKARAIFEDVSSEERQELLLDENKPTILKIDSLINHTFINESDSEVFFMAYTSYPFDENSPDTYRR